MRLFFDSSVLVAALLETHPSHAAARTSIIQCKTSRDQFGLSQHALLETYAVLTGMPARPKLSPFIVRLAMKDLLSSAEIVPLSPNDYEECLNRAESADVSGGTTYDLLHLLAAENWGADRLMTLNSKHFRRMGTVSALTIVEP